MIGSGTVNGQLTGKLAGLTGQPGVAGKRADVRLDLDLTDPANAEAFRNFVQDPVLGTPDLVGRFADDSQIGVRLYDASQTNVGLEAVRVGGRCRVWSRRGW